MLVVALNGFLGHRVNYLDVTEIVHSSMQVLPKRESITVITGHGGAGPIAFNRLVKKVASFSGQDRVLCLVGKSYGGHWCVKLLWRLAEQEKLDGFKAVGMVTVDPAFALYKLQKRTEPIPKIDKAVNIHQYGFRSGYRVGDPAINIEVKADHKTIEETPAVSKEIQNLLLWGHVKQQSSGLPKK